MKRQILFSAIIMGAASLMAQQPVEYPGYMFCGISQNGKYAVSYYYDLLGIIDTTTGNEVLPLQDSEYAIGVGNMVSNDGILVGTQGLELKASYCIDGFWKEIEGVGEYSMSYAQGISADSQYIIGSVSPKSYSGDFNGTLLVPCLWQKTDDGYGDITLLPCPHEDLTGRSPMYITAIRISDDGKTIAGQIIDFTGYIAQPIIYSLDDSGKWSYSLPVDDLFHPADITFPPYPGLDSPVKEDFMTEEELQKYKEALEAWEEDDEYYPVIDDFMTPQELLDYIDASMAYNKEYDAFMEVYYKLIAEIPLFEFNNVFLSGEGKYYASTDVKTYFDPSTFNYFSINVPYLINVSDDTYKSFPDSELNIFISSLNNDGSMLGSFNDGDIRKGYYLPAGTSKFQPLESVIANQNPDLADWMEETMTHEYLIIDPETYISSYEDILATGIPFSTPDQKYIVTSIENLWDDNYSSSSFAPCYSYFMSPGLSGIKSVKNPSSISINALRGGQIAVNGDYKTISIYNLAGNEMFRSGNAQPVINTGLKQGIYILRLTTLEGEVITRKIYF